MDLHSIIAKQINGVATNTPYQWGKPYCYFDSHEWVNGYGWPADINEFVGYSMHKKGAVMLPYQVCRHCQKRKEI